MNDVSTTSTNIAIDKRIGRRLLRESPGVLVTGSDIGADIITRSHDGVEPAPCVRSLESARRVNAVEGGGMSEIDRMYNESRSTKLGVGWLAFAASLLVISGIFKILDAIWAWKYDDEVSESVQTIVFERDLAAWGWIWLLLGILLIVAGFAVVKGMEWARWFGIVVLAVAAIANYSWIVWAPLWTLVLEGIYAAAIYGLMVYGGRRDDFRPPA
jgi:hypothetical protein